MYQRHRERSVLFAIVLILSAVSTVAPPAVASDACGQPPRSLGALPLDTSTFGPRAESEEDGTSRGGQSYRIVNRFYVVRQADGSGGIDESLIPGLMRDLNYGFRDTPFVFVREPGVTYIDDDTYYAGFPTFPSMIPMLDAYYEDGVVNWFLVPSVLNGAAPASTWNGPPYTTGARGILMTYAATGTPTNIVTPPHEMGHVFLLWHPFETAFGTECTSGSNCATAGDLLCDTPASPTVFGGNTTGTGIYFGNQPGPCPGDPVYAPNTRLYMEAGWAAGHILRNQFTPEQVTRMVGALAQQQPDLVGPDRPDVLVDCDGSGMDDIDEIESGALADLNRDAVPDVCQVFPAPDDLIVCGMTPDVFNRPRYFDGRTGAYRGALWNGLSWTHQLRFGPDGLIYMPRLTLVDRLDVRTGRSVDNFIDGVLEGAGTFVDLLFTGNSEILVLDNASAIIRRYSAATGRYLTVFSNLGAAGMSSPKYMEYGPDGNIYVVGNGALSNTIQQVDAATGAVLGSFITPGAGGLGAGQGLVFHDDGRLYVSDGAGNGVLRYDAQTGAFVDVFVSAGSGGLTNPHGLRFGPDGNLYVASRGTHSVKRYSGATGAYLGDFVSPGSGGPPSTGGLNQPAGLLFCEGPAEATDLTLSHQGGAAGTTTLTWTAPSESGAPLLVYDTVGSTSAADFVGAGFCVEGDDGSDTTAVSTTTPPSGTVHYFVVLAENVCGRGAPRAARTCP